MKLRLFLPLEVGKKQTNKQSNFSYISPFFISIFLEKIKTRGTSLLDFEGLY